jgi:putative hemolysin
MLQAAGWTLLFVVGVVFGALYNAAETAVYVMNKTRLELRAETGSRSARILRAMIHRPANFLAVLLIGTNLSEYAATFAVSAMFVMAGYGDASEWYAMAVATPVLFVLCSSVPKNVAQRLPEPIAHGTSTMLSVTSRVCNACGLAPLVRGFAALLTRAAGMRGASHSPLGHESLTSIVAEGHASGILTHAQTIMADRVMRMAGVSLQNVMIPMKRVVSVPRDITREDVLEVIRRHNFSRLPVLDAGGQVVGVLNIYDVLAEEDGAAPSAKRNVPPGMKPPLVLLAGLTVTDALYHMQRDHAAMAIVESATGRHVGIVTTKDLIEEIVGEL